MILGLDVGGTQTDTVLIDGGQVVVANKTPTSQDLLETLREAIEKVLDIVDPASVDRMAFSTTLATNAIVQDDLEDTGMIVSAGPGIDPQSHEVGPSYHVVDGCLDHQGFEALPLRKESVMHAASRIREKGISLVGVVSKFSVRNPAHEFQATNWIEDLFAHIAQGHKVSGTLNFPRRITTTYLNAALHNVHANFTDALTQILKEKSLFSPKYLLKPDGGTIVLDESATSPASMAQSGPAAGVMGALALDSCAGTTLVLDVGGTTTDMSVVLDGAPLLSPSGIRIGPFQTLIRSLLTHSVGIGGDSEVRVDKEKTFRIGPFRKGNPAALGGPAPTPTDAMIALGLLKIGNRNTAVNQMKDLGKILGLDTVSTARKILKLTAKSIADSSEAFVHEINAQPVYTIHEVLQDQKIEPTSAIIMGGPAPHLVDYLQTALGIPCRVPDHFEVANAVGAAVARVTCALTLQADTSRGFVVIPEANIQNKIGSGFGLEDAILLGKETLEKRAVTIGALREKFNITVTEKQIFNMIRGYSMVGRNIRLKMSLTPGLIQEWRTRDDA